MRTSSTLTAKQLRELEAELERERTRLERRLAIASETGATSGELPPVGDVMHPPATHDVALAVILENRTQDRYDAIVAALARIEAATYGTCAGCTKPIPFGRLVVMPEATHCVRCGPQQ
ncbi:MAG TPA: TraR/DksA C4-type zinc finger protein [Gemmatimonadaceae bacterium]|nr:TraR/DksA C4-type zinc finger protein [Gemmatimonadaceae bacterium]